MKILITILLLLMPIITFAQNYSNMNEQDMQNMMKKIQTCMKNIDLEKLKELQEQSKKFETEIKSLCSSAKRDEAQKKAILFSEKIMKNSIIQSLKECGEITLNEMTKTHFMSENKDSSKEHICDEINKIPTSW
ncbi:MAG: hypothetical protein L3I99_08795 [Sulfurimonas sp.]|nr:hypothetical protein [Sulfurimonas sp.]